VNELRLFGAEDLDLLLGAHAVDAEPHRSGRYAIITIRGRVAATSGLDHCVDILTGVTRVGGAPVAVVALGGGFTASRVAGLNFELALSD
jgi:hypothetical protein